jgi:hypothetical protein
MSGLKKKVNVLLDPGNVFGVRAGGFNLTDAMDPGGKYFHEFTGSDKVRKFNDPLEIYSKGKVDDEPETILTYAQKREKRMESESKAADNQKMKRLLGRRNILNTKAEGL